MKYVFLICAMFVSSVAWAQAQTTEEKIQALEEKVEALQKEVEVLQQDREENHSEEKDLPAAIAIPPVPPEESIINEPVAMPPGLIPLPSNPMDGPSESFIPPPPPPKAASAPTVIMPDEDRKKIIADLQNKYRICQYRHVPKGAGEPQAIMELTNMDGTFGEREKRYRQYMAKYPGSPDMQTAYVQEMLTERMLKESHYYLSDALKRFPDDPKVRFLLDQYRYILANEDMDRKTLKRNLRKAFGHYDAAVRECVTTN